MMRTIRPKPSLQSPAPKPKTTPLLHGSWIMREHDGQFIFWGERAVHHAADLPISAMRSQPRFGSSYLPYPLAFAAEHFDSRSANEYYYPRPIAHLLDWGIGNEDGEEGYAGYVVSRHIALPDRSGHLAGWQVIGISPEISQIMAVLCRIATITPPALDDRSPYAALPHYSATRAAAQQRLGPDLLYWAAAASLLREMLAAGRFAPRVAVVEDRWRTQWQPLPNPDDTARIRYLAEVMPPACRTLAASAVQLEEILAGDASQPMTLLHDFLNSMTDAVVRERLMRQRDLMRLLDSHQREWLTHWAEFEAKTYYDATNAPLVIDDRQWCNTN